MGGGRWALRAPVGMSTRCCMETNLTINFIVKKKKNVSTRNETLKSASVGNAFKAEGS